ncbi:hypothetical protein ACJ41O_013585 [Fusarium nematophilum]
MGGSESKHSGAYYGQGNGGYAQGPGNSYGYSNGQSYGHQAYGQGYGQNPPPYNPNPPVYGQPSQAQPSYPPRPHSAQGLHPNGYAAQNPHPRPHSYAGPPPNAPQPQFNKLSSDRPFGLFASDFMVFLNARSSNKTFTLGKHPGDVQYRADISFGGHHKMQLYRMNGMGQTFIAEAKGVGFTGSRVNINWADGQFNEMKSSGAEHIKFDVGGDTFIWVKADKHEISGILGREAGKGFKLVRQGMERAEVFAVFRQSGRFDYSKSEGWLCFIGRGASGQMGPHWANMAVMAMLKLWQIKAISKMAEITGESVGAAASAAAGV